MSAPFKFRYANELAGALTLACLAALLGGVVVAGRAQGWFEGSFTLLTRFETDAGTHGLREGSEVRVRDTPAGKVAEIRATETGGLEAHLVLRARFHPFVRVGAVGKVRRTFGVAGDAYLDIAGPAQGDLIPDGAILPCSKDEELLETAQAALADARERFVPLLEHVEGILGHARGIVGGLDRGEGAIGALLRDPDTAADVRTTLDQVNGLVRDTRDAVRQTTRLIRGAQGHWLLRRYVPAEDVRSLRLGAPSARCAQAELDRDREAFQESRMAADPWGVARDGYNYGMCLLAAGRLSEFETVAAEVRLAAGESSATAALAALMDAQALRRGGGADRALETLRKAETDGRGETDRRLALCRALLAGDMEADQGRTDLARAEWKTARGLARRLDDARAEEEVSRLEARILLAEGDAKAAAGVLDALARQTREAGRYEDMAERLAAAGEAWAAAGDWLAAADRQFRAGRSLVVAGFPADAAVYLDRAVSAAQRTSAGAALADRAAALLAEARAARVEGVKPAAPDPAGAPAEDREGA